MKNIRYFEGDATCPEGDGLKIIVHCCNTLGVWGAGFVLALSKKWERPEREYRTWAEQHGEARLTNLLGAVQLVPVEADIAVANLIGQEGVGRKKGPPIRYEAISRGFGLLAQHITKNPELNVSIHAPRIGCGLAGASWAKIEPLLNEHFGSRGTSVTIYDWPGSAYNP